MTPGGGSVRRRAPRLALVAAVAAVVLAVGSPARAAEDVGEDESGPAPMRVVRESNTTGFVGTRATKRIAFSDVGLAHAWALTAIRHVAGTYPWMRDFAPLQDGSYPFHPGAAETRRYFARALVKAFAPNRVPDPTVRFADLDASSPWYRWAAVAVDAGWMSTGSGGRFEPDEPVTMAMVHRGLTWALGLRGAARDLNAIHTVAGQRFRVPPNFGGIVLGMRLELRYNAPSGSEGMDVAPGDVLSRAQVAYSLWRATTLPEWAVGNMRTQYRDIELPYLGPKKLAMVRWGIRYAGYPYVWGGEWGFDRQEPPALGGQPRSGFDCSGFSWWILRADDGAAWNIAPPRPYRGWSLPQRTSAEMAANASPRLPYRKLEPGDLMFYDGDRDGTVDHVDTYIGNGYALDSSSTPGGVTIMWVGDGWYRDHFEWGRRILSR